jgi:hypothetical protein
MFPKPTVVEVTDTQLTAYYDERLRKYVAYTRTLVTQPCSAHVIQHEALMRKDLPVKAPNWY